jgi:hypothetical protein
MKEKSKNEYVKRNFIPHLRAPQSAELAHADCALSVGTTFSAAL